MDQRFCITLTCKSCSRSFIVRKMLELGRSYMIGCKECHQGFEVRLPSSIHNFFRYHNSQNSGFTLDVSSY